MAIKVNYNFKGIEVKDAYVRVDRLWGSSKEGWTSLVGVYNITQEDVPEVTEEVIVEPEVRDDNGLVLTQAVKETKVVTEATVKDVFNKIEDFNFSAKYVDGERGYESLYSELITKYGGVEC